MALDQISAKIRPVMANKKKMKPKKRFEKRWKRITASNLIKWWMTYRNKRNNNEQPIIDI